MTRRIRSCRAPQGASVGLAAALAATGCVDHQPGITGVQSLEVTLVSPASPGSPAMRLTDAQHKLTLDLAARDADGQPDASLTTDLQVYAQFLGTLTPALGSPTPLAKIHLEKGVAKGQVIDLPANALGPTTVWIEDGAGSAATYATGSSPALWYRDPVIEDVQRPLDEKALDALATSPLANKNIDIRQSGYPGTGRLLVTSVFSQGYTVSDVECADAAGTPPCTTDPYHGLLIFSFSAPRDTEGRLIKVGQTITGFAGGVSLFNGLIEVSFPQTFVTGAPDVDERRLPPPTKVDPAKWFGPLSSPDGVINFKRWQATPIEIDGAAVCDLDDDYATYKQWKLDPTGVGGDCSGNKNVLNVITAGVVSFDPATKVGVKATKVVGVLRPVSIGSFNVWIIYPRSSADLVFP